MVKEVRKTQNIKELWKKKRFKNWDEAFRSLTPTMRQQSVRVAEYAKVLFDGACRASVYLKEHDTPVYMEESFKEVAYKCGFYHQIGKALAPEEYPSWKDSFTDEEKSRYCKYAVEGRELVAKLQGEKGENLKLASRMIQEACEYHMERWDGSGFPYGYAGNEIPLIAQIVGLAKELDRLVCERKSETPFEDAVDLILQKEGSAFSENLIEVFRERQPELRNIYKNYIQYTKTMPKTIPLVEKRPERPFGLNFRQIADGTELADFIFEAVPWYGELEESPKTIEYPEDMEGVLQRTGLLKDMGMYFLYEAADLIARVKNCDLRMGGVLVPMFADFFIGQNMTEKLEGMFEDTEIDRKKLMLSVPGKLAEKDRSAFASLSSYIEKGIVLVLDDYDPEELPIALLREIGITHVRLCKAARTAVVGSELLKHGIFTIDEPAGAGQLSEDELIAYLGNHEV